jgi:hypothetical protein
MSLYLYNILLLNVKWVFWQGHFLLTFSVIENNIYIIYRRYNDLVCDYKLPLAHMLDDLFHTIC